MGGYVVVLLVFFFSSSLAGEPLNGTELLKEVCSHTSDYAFCIQVLSSDANAGARDALARELVNAALRLAQSKASGSYEAIIAYQPNNASASAVEQRLIQRCEGDSSKAVSALSLANSDFNADSIPDMVKQMQNAVAMAEDCQLAMREGDMGDSGLAAALEEMNGEVMKLCEIGLVSSEYFSALDFV